MKDFTPALALIGNMRRSRAGKRRQSWQSALAFSCWLFWGRWHDTGHQWLVLSGQYGWRFSWLPFPDTRGRAGSATRAEGRHTMSAALKPRPPRLSDADRQEIRRIYAEGKASQHTIARRFGVSQHTVFVVVTEARKK